MDERADCFACSGSDSGGDLGTAELLKELSVAETFTVGRDSRCLVTGRCSLVRKMARMAWQS